jgi:flagellar FliL protein
MAVEDEASPEVAEKPKKSGLIKTAILMSVFSIVVVGASVGTTLLLVGGDKNGAETEQAADGAGAKKDAKKDAKKKDDKKKAKDEEKKPDTTVFFELAPPFVVNFTNPGRTRFLQVAVQVAAESPAVVENIQKFAPVIRNNLVLLLSSQNSEELRSREGKEKLRGEVLTEIQTILKERAGSAGVREVFFTSFVMQ